MVGERQAVFAPLDALPQLFLDQLPDVGRVRQHPNAVGVGAATIFLSVDPLHSLADADHTVLEVNVAAVKLGDFTEAQRAPNRQLDHQPKLLRRRRH